MRVLLINNLSAGIRPASTYDFMRAAAGDGDEIVMRVTDSTTPVESFLSDAASFDAVAVAGGDGTIASVSYALAGTGIPLLPLPTGTANLLALNLDSPIEPYALAKMLHEGKTLTFDIGELQAGGFRTGFSLIAGAGFDARIMQNASAMKPSLGQAAYWIAGLVERKAELAHFTLTLDGRVIETDGTGVLLVNFGKVQFDLSITPNNDPRDGLLEVAILKPEYTIQLFPALMSAMLDRTGAFPTRSSAIELHHCHEMRLESDLPLPIQYDGEPIGRKTPLTARILPGAVRYIVDGGSDIIKRYRNS